MAHRNAKLTPLGRLLLVQRVVYLGWSVSQAAVSLGISRPTVHKWLRRWCTTGLEDASSRPHTSPRLTPPDQVEQIRVSRLRLRWGPHRLAALLGKSRSTIYAVLQREGLSRLRDLDPTTGVPIRYVRDKPGELIHVDMKPLGRVPAGGGHRVLGKEVADRHQGVGYEVVHVAVDDASRLAFVQILPDRRGETAAQFMLDAASFFAQQGIHIERVMTDRDVTYRRARAFKTAVHRLRARHKMTRPLPSPNQWQSGAVYQNPPPRVGVCSALSVQRGAARGPNEMAPLLQSPPSPHWLRRPGAGGTECKQRVWEPQLAHGPRRITVEGVGSAECPPG